MRLIYINFNQVPEDKKISDKVMMSKAVLTAIVILLCLAAMSFSAFAYFTSDISSNSNTIKAAYFETNITISDCETTETADGGYTALLKAGKTYDVIISRTQNSTAKTGFCIIAASGNKNSYHTRQINEENPSVSFTISVTEDTNVSFYSKWGTSSYYTDYIENGDSDLYIIDSDALSITITNNNPPASNTLSDTNDSAENNFLTEQPSDALQNQTASDSQSEPQAEPESETEAEQETEAETETETEPEVETETETEVETETEPESEPESETESETEANTETETETEIEEQTDSQSDEQSTENIYA